MHRRTNPPRTREDNNLLKTLINVSTHVNLFSYYSSFIFLTTNVFFIYKIRYLPIWLNQISRLKYSQYSKKFSWFCDWQNLMSCQMWTLFSSEHFCNVPINSFRRIVSFCALLYVLKAKMFSGIEIQNKFVISSYFTLFW